MREAHSAKVDNRNRSAADARKKGRRPEPMKDIVKGGIVVAFFVVPVAIAFMVIIALNPFVNSSYYATIEDARKDELFERGWLPPILPESTREITTNNHLDSNTSAGEFYLAPRDVGPFVSLLQRPDAETGFAAFTDPYGVTWLFRCDGESGHCKYQLPYGSYSAAGEER